LLRIRIVRKPAIASLDGIRFSDFEVGGEYVVGTVTGEVLLAEGWGVPIDEPAPTAPPYEPVYVIRREIDPQSPPNLLRDKWPPPFEERFAIAAERKRRRSDRN
jgi:hypothetical protein